MQREPLAEPGKPFSATRWGILAVILVVAAVTRFWGLRFGLPTTECRPDESRILNLAVRIAQGDPNPHYFVYPTLYMYLVAVLLKVQAIAHGLRDVAQLPPETPFLVGRALTATLGSATVLIVYGIGRQLADVRTGLMAAAFLALSFLHVRDSHFATTDVSMVAAVMFAVWLILRSDHSLTAAGRAGFVAGLATALKYNALLLAAVVVAHECQRLLLRERGWRDALSWLATFAALMAAGFLVGTPFALIDRPAFLAGIRFVGEHLQTGHIHDGEVLAVHHAAWRYLSFMLPAAMGWPLFLGGVAGMAALGWRRPRGGVAFLVFPLVYFATASRGATVLFRYMLPVVPFLCVGAAFLLSTVVRWLPRARTGPVMAAAALACAAPSAIAVVRLDTLLAKPDNRLIVRAWFDANLPPGASVWQSGSRYGKVQLSQRFTSDDAAMPGHTQYVIVQKSPLTQLYSRIPAGIDEVLRERYVLIGSFKTGSLALAEDDYDAADAFFLPLVHLDRVKRAGPEFEVFARRTN